MRHATNYKIFSNNLLLKYYCFMSSSVTSQKLVQKLLDERETKISLLPSRNSKINATDMMGLT